LAKNPTHYNFEGDAAVRSLDDRIEQICSRNIALLQQADLLSFGQKLKCSTFGEAMARYCVKFETMKLIVGLPRRAKMPEMVSLGNSSCSER
jgi:ATP-dependent DNA helicase HFM1/MER3